MKPYIICISGKRFSGKGITVKLILVILYKIKRIKKLSSDREINKLDFDRFMTDHDYKDFYRNQLTAYYDSIKDPYYFTKRMEEWIDGRLQNNPNHIYILDDVRCLEDQINYLNRHCKTKWNIKTIRINSTDTERQKKKKDGSEHLMMTIDVKMISTTINYLIMFLIITEQLMN